MKIYSENKNYKLYQGNMLDMLEVIEPNSIDSIITDPPYELNFMGKGWDNAGISFQSDTWKKCYEVLKPGGYLLAFGGSRTFHRIACAIEDAGFEIRDTIMWLYGSGFPKSMNIGLAIDKKNGVESKVVGKSKSGSTSKAFNLNEQQREAGTGILAGEYDLKEAQNEWNGWGTALKPSYESIIVAQKPYSIEIYLLIEILDILNEVIDKCQLNLNANVVEKISKLNQAKQSVEENIVLNNAESKMFTKEDLLEVMDMLQSILMENTNLNTELLCLNFLVEICNQMSKYTTETKINLITELKILKLLVVENILKNTTQENKMKQLGMKQNVLTVEEFLKEEKLKLNYMNILSVQDNVILKEEKSNLHPSLNQIIVARKPFKGSLVDNVIENGVGGINIDECRVETNDNLKPTKRGSGVFSETANGKITGWNKDDYNGDYQPNNLGRFPANTILTYDETNFDEVCGGFPKDNKGQSNARYFYCAKASKKDRDEGLDEFEEKNMRIEQNRSIHSAGCEYVENGKLKQNPHLQSSIKKNIHPTVKPTDLMQYLVRLVTPNNGVVLDPFNGSGSTGKAVMYENKERNKNYKYIGIELTEEYLPIAKARIEYVCNLKSEVNPQISIFDYLESKGE